MGTRSSAAALFALALLVFGLQSLAIGVYPGRDMGRYLEAFFQLGYAKPVMPSVVNERGPLAALGVGVPLELGRWAVEIWLGLLYASSILAWGAVARRFGPRAAVLTTLLLLANPGYGILFHGLASDSLFAAAFAGWAVLLTRSILMPSVATELIAGVGMGALVLVRPANQVLVVFALLPLLFRAPWSRRLAWVAAFFIGSAAVTQGWLAVKYFRYGASIAPKPSSVVLVTAVALVPLLLPPPWRRRLAVVGLGALIGVLALQGRSMRSPTSYARTVVQSPGGTVFLFRAFEIDRIVSPDNGPASMRLAKVVQRDLLSQEPYRSYNVGLHTFFAAGSDRIFQDVQTLGAKVDLGAVTSEAIRAHRSTFVAGIARTNWDLLWTRRVYAPEGPSSGVSGTAVASPRGTSDFIVVNGRRLPRPTEGQPIPASRFAPSISTIGGPVREEWGPRGQHHEVFADPRDARRLARLGRDTDRLTARIAARSDPRPLVHRLNQASHRFPAPLVWLVAGLMGVGLRRPRHTLVALALTAAALTVIFGTSLVAFAVAEYAAPVVPAFVLLAAAGLVGAEPRGPSRLLRWRSEPHPTSPPAQPRL